MIPGFVSKLSESVLAITTSISPKTELVMLTGAGTIQTIVPPLSGGRNGQILWLVPKDGGVTLGTSGNILVGATVAQNRVCTLIYSEIYDKWSVGAIS